MNFAECPFTKGQPREWLNQRPHMLERAKHQIAKQQRARTGDAWLQCGWRPSSSASGSLIRAKVFCVRPNDAESRRPWRPTPVPPLSSCTVCTGHPSQNLDIVSRGLCSRAVLFLRVFLAACHNYATFERRYSTEMFLIKFSHSLLVQHLLVRQQVPGSH